MLFPPPLYTAVKVEGVVVLVEIQAFAQGHYKQMAAVS